MKDIEVEIITIGDELLIGQVVDTNSAWMARELNKEGFRVRQITTVSDDIAHICTSIETAMRRADIVLMTGGLGPTRDDRTKQALCTSFNTELVFDQTVLDTIHELYKDRPQVVNELTNTQAYVPKTATIIQNQRGTAPITWFEQEDRILVSMPGVPSEMQWVMNHEILPRLKTHFKTPNLKHQSMLVIGIPESALAIKLSHWENNLPPDIALAYLPSAGMVKLRLTGDRKSYESLDADLQTALVSLRAILGSAILAEEDAPVEVIIGNLLRENKLTIATAESCTGGNIAHLLTSIPGSSGYFMGSVVAYNNSVKTNLLGVSPQTLLDEGAVSRSIAEQMAAGVRERLQTDIGIATTGIAGPDGGTPEKPVGTVWICACSRNTSICRNFQFGTFRSRNIDQASLNALAMVKELIDNEKTTHTT